MAIKTIDINPPGDDRPGRGRSQRDAAPDLDIELESLARWLDSVFKIPGLNIRFGLDALLGLIPGLGDTVTSLASFYILNAASRQGVPRVTLVRMAGNIALDYVVGVVPFLGDIFDVYWKANLRNIALLKRHRAEDPQQLRQARRGDWLFVLMLCAGLLLLLVGSITIALLIVGALGRLLFGTGG